MNKYSDILNQIETNKSGDWNTNQKSSDFSMEESNSNKIDNAIANLIGTKLILTFPYSPSLVAKVKQISGRKYIPETKQWEVKSSLLALKKIVEIGFNLDDKATKEYKNLLDNLVKNDVENTKFDITKIKTPDGLELRPYQKNTVGFIESRKGKAILALDPGTGKTPIVCTYIYNNPKIKPIIIVVPAVLKRNWEIELNKWTNNTRQIQILSGKKPYKLDKNSDIIILNYDIIDAWKPELVKIKPQLLVLDESQYIKAIKGVKRTKAVKSLAKKCKYILPLSGTPVVSRTADLWNIINMVEPNMFGSWYEFGERYCAPQINPWGTTYNGSSNTDELNRILSNIMIRYRKEDVLPELPDKQFSFIPMDLNNRMEYNRAEQDFIEYTRETKGNAAAVKVKYAEKLAKMTELRQLAVNGALDNSVEWIKNFLEGSNEKLVVFAIHRTVLDRLNEEFGDISIRIDGSTPQDKRQEMIDKFQNNPDIRLAILQVKTAGTGITLTAASNCAFLELVWTPAELVQAYSRVDRLGQKNNVNIYFLLPENTVEDKLATILTKKQKLIDKLVDNVETNESDTLEELMGLI